MKNCKCGSMAINPNTNERGEDLLELCDVCYWKAKYEQAESALQNIVGYLSDSTIVPPVLSAAETCRTRLAGLR